MAYIDLKQLKEILPCILDQWIDEDDESWEWIFQEIEQKCYVGGTERINKKGKKWKKAIENSINILNQRVSDFIKDYGADIRKSKEEINNLNDRYTAMASKINSMNDNITAAMSMAQTAKQRTEVDYTQMSKVKSDAEVIQDVYNRMRGRGATKEELDSFRHLIHKYDALEKKEVPVCSDYKGNYSAWEAKENV